jgi:opacity protein-like surface antigen
MTLTRLAASAALAAAVAAPLAPAHANVLNGCQANSAQTCEFVAGGDVRYVAAGLAGCTITVIRDYSVVYTFSGNLPPTGVITEAEAGDRIRVYAGYAQAPYMQTTCDVRDAQ